MGSGTLLKSEQKAHGIENFSKRIIEVCETEEQAYEREAYWIKENKALGSMEYYNLSKGGRDSRVDLRDMTETEKTAFKKKRKIVYKNNGKLKRMDDMWNIVSKEKEKELKLIHGEIRYHLYNMDQEVGYTRWQDSFVFDDLYISSEFEEHYIEEYESSDILEYIEMYGEDLLEDDHNLTEAYRRYKERYEQ